MNHNINVAAPLAAKNDLPRVSRKLRVECAEPGRCLQTLGI